MQDVLTTIATILEGAIAILLLFGFVAHSTRPISEPETVSFEAPVEEPISIEIPATAPEPLPIDYTGLKLTVRVPKSRND